jgi:hypothetical protein
MDAQQLKQAGFNDNEIGEYTKLQSAGFTDTEISDHLSGKPPPQLQDKSLLSKLGERWDEMGRINQYTQGPDVSPIRKIINTPGAALMQLGQIGGAVGDVLAEPIKKVIEYSPPGVAVRSIYQSLPDNTRTKLNENVSGAMRSIAEPISGTLGELEERYPIGMRMAGDMLNATSLIPAGVLTKRGSESVVDAAKYAKNVVKPAPTANEALGQILQGKSATLTKDYAKGERAFSNIDVKNVKTYSDLKTRLDEAIPIYSKRVDDELSKDTTIYPMDRLITPQRTSSGKMIKQNHVETALDNLGELYTKTNDPVNAQEMIDLMVRAKTQGLSKFEVNNIARQYNAEFGRKAFSPQTGDPLTSVNAQAYENTRKGLKDVARRGLSDNAKELDQTISSLYNTRRLVEKNVERVNALRQKIDQRGLGEKIGGALLTTLDTLTMGVGKGAVLKLIPRGMGYKVKNALDLEKSLARNLKIVDETLAAKGDQQIINAIRKLNSQKALPPGNPTEGTLNNVSIPGKEMNVVRGTEVGNIGKPYSTEPPLIPQPALRAWNPYYVTDDIGRPSIERPSLADILKEQRKQKMGLYPERDIPRSASTYYEAGTPFVTPKTSKGAASSVRVKSQRSLYDYEK